jgi:hypothetical protein
MEDVKTRLALVEQLVTAHMAGTSEAVQEIKHMLKTSAAERVIHNTERVTNHTETIRRLAIIENNQVAFIKYQEECDIDRKETDTRLKKVETDASRVAGQASIFAGVIASIAAGAVELISAFYGSVHK